MLKKVIFTAVAICACFSCSLFANETETIVTRPWGGEVELKGLGNKKIALTTAALPLKAGKTYRFKCNMTKIPPIHKQGYNNRIILCANVNKKYTTLLRLGTEIPADEEAHKIDVVFTVPADAVAPFNLQIYNAYCTGSVIVEDFVITETKAPEQK